MGTRYNELNNCLIKRCILSIVFLVALIKLRGKNNLSLVENELEQLEEEKWNLSKQTEFAWSDFWKKTYLFRPMVVTVVIQLSQQFSGINAVIFLKFLTRNLG